MIPCELQLALKVHFEDEHVEAVEENGLIAHLISSFAFRLPPVPMSHEKANLKIQQITTHGAEQSIVVDDGLVKRF